MREYTGRPKGFGRRDFCDLIVRAHTQLGGPIVLIRDNARLHLAKPLQESTAAHAEWLTVFQLPAHAPDLSPTRASGRWSGATSAISPQATPARSPEP
ncbi:transposase [Streptomyces sp. NPDC007189]|uniref:transposase n=1 Tax=Streptomyces sp. NPDC007189 TaxID=3154315 RepID=UPI00345650F3